jgi:hypothetical protein
MCMYKTGTPKRGARFRSRSALQKPRRRSCQPPIAAASSRPLPLCLAVPPRSGASFCRWAGQLAMPVLRTASFARSTRYPLGGHTGTELSVPSWTAVQGDTRRLPTACGARAAAWGLGGHSARWLALDKAAQKKGPALIVCLSELIACLPALVGLLLPRAALRHGLLRYAAQPIFFSKKSLSLLNLGTCVVGVNTYWRDNGAVWEAHA